MKEDVFMNRLRFLRKKHKLTQKDIAKILNTTQNTISNWESGRQEPSYKKLTEICKVFNISVEYLFGTDAKTWQIIEDIKPRLLENARTNGSDFTKWCLKDSLEKLNTAKERYENEKTKENLLDLTLAKIHWDDFIFDLAADEILYIDPDYVN